MKNVLLTLLVLIGSASLFAQPTIELRNNSGQSLDVVVVITNGSSFLYSPPVTLPGIFAPASETVDNWWNNNAGGFPPVLNSYYVVAVNVACAACSDNFTVDNSKPYYEVCAGTPIRFPCNFDFDGSTKSLILHNN